METSTDYYFKEPQSQCKAILGDKIFKDSKSLPTPTSGSISASDEAKREQNKRYYAKHKEELQKKNGERYIKNRDAILRKAEKHRNKPEVKEHNKAYQKGYCNQHKKELREWSEEYYKKHKKKINARNTCYREEHKEEIAKSKAKWKQEHKEHLKNYNQRPNVKPKLQCRAKTRHKYPDAKKDCEVCSTKEKLQFHHPDYTNPDKFNILCKEHHDTETYGRK